MINSESQTEVKLSDFYPIKLQELNDNMIETLTNTKDMTKNTEKSPRELPNSD